MTNSVGLGAKTYSYLIDDDSEYIKAKQTNNCVDKFEYYKNCLEATKLEISFSRKWN